MQTIDIRYARREDIPGMAHVYIRSWQAAYRDILSAKFLKSLSEENWIVSHSAAFGQEGKPLSAVMTDGGRIVGVSSFSGARDNDLSDKYAEIISLYLLPEYWSLGLGARLLYWVQEELRSQGFTHCVLWTLAENSRAQRAYERAGFMKDGSSKQADIGGTETWEIRYKKQL